MADKTDWFKVITALERSGMSQEKIGKAVGRDHTMICRYKEGTEPKHSVGERILEMYRSLTGNSAEMQST
jgi:hypothetical protein